MFAGTRIPVRIQMEHLEAGDRLDNFLTDSSVVSRCLTVARLQRATRILRWVADDAAV